MLLMEPKQNNYLNLFTWIFLYNAEKKDKKRNASFCANSTVHVRKKKEMFLFVQTVQYTWGKLKNGTVKTVLKSSKTIRRDSVVWKQFKISVLII